MQKINIRHLDIKRNYSSKTPNYFNKKNIVNKHPLRINKNYFGESNKEIKKNKIKNKSEEEKSDINIFNKTYNNKPMFRRITPKDNLYINNNRKSIPENQKIIDSKKLPRNMSTHSLSKDSTLYKTKNRFLSSAILERYKNKNQTMVSPKKSTFYHKNGRSFSALNINNKNSYNNLEAKKSRTLGSGGFITALDPIIGQNQVGFNKSNDRSDNRSYFIRKINEEKKFLSYFDIQRILFLDRKVYKPDKEFEKKIYDLKNNNSDEFIMNFNFDKYKITILRLFQNHVSSKNYEIMKKYFENINKGWRWKNNSRKLRRRIVKKDLSFETDRELRYNQMKFERQNKIREKYSKNKKV